MSLETMTKLGTVSLSGTQASVTFSNIPQNYTDLKVVISGRCDSTSGFPETVNLRFNGSSASEYTWRGLFSVTATPGSNGDTSVTLIRAGNVNSVAQTANTFSNTEIYIPNYAGSTNKSVSIDAITETNGSTDFTYSLIMNAGIRNNPAAITSITLSLSAGNFVANSTFTIYGIKNAQRTAGNSIKATGGNIVFDGTYVYHVFNSTGVFTPTQPILADALVVAGGGSGGWSGGGGAGGVRSTSNTVSSITPVIVGAGGSVATGLALGNNGSNSSFGSFSASGGGRGGYGTNDASQLRGGVGGSGGGNGSGYWATVHSPLGAAGNAGSYTPVEGYAGGSGAQNTDWGGGGGGGAGSVGGNGTTVVGGNGGAGVSNSISGGSITGAGQLVSGSYFFGGGGGGGTYYSRQSTGGNGGGGIGGNGSGANSAGSGTANTGGGGGGGASDGTQYFNSGQGGSGIVIIRYKG